MSLAIEVTRLRKSYGNHTVLKGLDFQVKKGEIFALLGTNGAGKTTALECIEGLRRYDEGNIEINGKPGIQLQSASLPSHIKPMEAVRLFAKWNRAKIDFSMLKSLGIDELAGKQYIGLSTGQKRRLHLALALVCNPDIVFLDEPTAGLDVEGRVSLHEQIRRLKAQGKTVILASHDMAEVETLCDRIAILSGGSIAFLGAVSDLTEKVGKQHTIYVKTDRGETRLPSDNIRDTLLELLTDYKRQGVSITEIQTDRGSLEQHFMQIAKGDEK